MTEVDEDWKLEGVCRSVDPELWFPEHGVSAAAAKRVCVGCPIQKRCLDHALAHDERWGVWGGFSERDRRKLKRGIPVELIELKPREPARSCLTCGSELTGHKLAKYCSKPCLRMAERERWNEKRRKAA